MSLEVNVILILNASRIFYVKIIFFVLINHSSVYQSVELQNLSIVVSIVLAINHTFIVKTFANLNWKVLYTCDDKICILYHVTYLIYKMIYWNLSHLRENDNERESVVTTTRCMCVHVDVIFVALRDHF